MSVHLKPSQTVNTNLYCCNLPLAADKDDLLSLFAPFGQLTHCTILATLDAAGRRRAFLDFASPAQAAEAKQQTHTKLWQGYALEVTYATVQRSTGPLSIYEAPPGAWDKDRPRPRTNSEATFEYVPAMGQVASSASIQASQVIGSGKEEEVEGATVVVTNLDLGSIGSAGALLSVFNSLGNIKHAYVDAPNQVGVLSFARKTNAHVAVSKMNGAQIGRRMIEVVVWEDWEEQERERHSDHASSTDWHRETNWALDPPAPSISPSPPTFSPNCQTQQFYTHPIETPGLKLNPTCAPISAPSAPTRAPDFGITSPFPSPTPSGWPPTADATDHGQLAEPSQARSPLGTIQLNPAAREFIGRR